MLLGVYLSPAFEAAGARGPQSVVSYGAEVTLNPLAGLDFGALHLVGRVGGESWGGAVAGTRLDGVEFSAALRYSLLGFASVAAGWCGALERWPVNGGAAVDYLPVLRSALLVEATVAIGDGVRAGVQCRVGQFVWVDPSGRQSASLSAQCGPTLAAAIW